MCKFRTFKSLLILLVFMTFSFSGCYDQNIVSDSMEEAPSEMIPQVTADEELSRYYFDSFEFVDSGYDEETGESTMVYNVSYEGDNYSYKGKVDLVCTPYADGDDPEEIRWYCYLNYEEDFNWNIIGDWAEDDKPALELHISGVDQDNGTVDFSAVKYGGVVNTFSEEKEETEDADCESILDFSGKGELFAGDRQIINPDESESEEQKYQPPTLSFKFEFNSGTAYAIVVEADVVAYSCSVHGEIFRGEMYRNTVIQSHVNEFGYVEYKKVTK